MQEVVLLSRLAAGYDTDRFIFEYNGKTVKKYYGSRLTSEQAKSLFFIEMRRQTDDKERAF